MKTILGIRPKQLWLALGNNRCFHLLAMFFFLFFFQNIGAQEEIVEKKEDSILYINLDEVVLISSRKALGQQKQTKPLSSLDEYLESAQKVNMVKRGAYAWEPTLNNMFSERLSITIDGMRIFGACTDKMDPITSYVDVSNLSKAHVVSGQQGSEHGTTIGGAMNLELHKSNFANTGLKGSLESGFETNNELRIIGTALDYSSEKFYIDGDIIYRKAENYFDGKGNEVGFSQYGKYNFSANGGYKVNDGGKLTATLIFDEARNVGYPALPMDVSLAKALITSVGFEQDKLGTFSDWKSKLYFNKVTHIMDDSKRPDVPIRMDMPGWSDTYGFLSQLQKLTGKHNFLLKWDGFYNKSLAEMTMYPNNPNESAMFMLTWPDVRTLNTGFYAHDQIDLKGGSLKLSTRITLQNNKVADELGLNSLRIFYSDMEQAQNHFLKSVSVQYHRHLAPFHVNLGMSYGDRAPSVSEGYGFFLFNSFDNYDYIGNPGLKNEKSFEGNAKISVQRAKFKTSLEGNIFHISDYIIGEVDPMLSAMTIGAEGVKVYSGLKYADLVNVSWDLEYSVLPELKWSWTVSYHRGTDNDHRNLPFISPVAYRSSLSYKKKTFSGTMTMQGAGKQTNFNGIFGEDQTQAYTVFALAFGKTFYLSNDWVYTKVGLENIFDKYYSTYTDWNNIPRMGRNFFLSLSYSIN